MTAQEHADNSTDCMIAAGSFTDTRDWELAFINAAGGVQQALLAVNAQLQRLNDSRDEFHREVLAVLSEAKQPKEGG